MGTRHLIAVIKDGQHKIAQYGQWDGYPDGQGVDVLAFTESLAGQHIPGVAENFAAALDRCRYAKDDAELERIWADRAYRETYLTRDLGSDILDNILSSDGEIVLRDSYSFAADGLFCEWAYVIDLDARTLEVYKGFAKTDPPEGERFHGVPRDTRADGSVSEYGAVHLAKTYSFDALPSREQFLADLSPAEEEEAA
jgi:hypothetical protein